MASPGEGLGDPADTGRDGLPEAEQSAKTTLQPAVTVLQCEIEHRALGGPDRPEGKSAASYGQPDIADEPTLALLRRADEQPHPLRDDAVDGVFHGREPLVVEPGPVSREPVEQRRLLAGVLGRVLLLTGLAVGLVVGVHAVLSVCPASGPDGVDDRVGRGVGGDQVLAACDHPGELVIGLGGRPGAVVGDRLDERLAQLVERLVDAGFAHLPEPLYRQHVIAGRVVAFQVRVVQVRDRLLQPCGDLAARVPAGPGMAGGGGLLLAFLSAPEPLTLPCAGAPPVRIPAGAVLGHRLLEALQPRLGQQREVAGPGTVPSATRTPSGSRQ